MDFTYRIFLKCMSCYVYWATWFSMAMEERTGGSGNASSLLGLFQFILGGIISPIVGLKGQYDATPYIFVIMITAVILITLQVIYFRNHRKPA